MAPKKVAENEAEPLEGLTARIPKSLKARLRRYWRKRQSEAAEAGEPEPDIQDIVAEAFSEYLGNKKRGA